jgi:prephenate dehydratase
MLKVAFRGVRGAYAEEAAKKFFQEEIELIPFRDLEHVAEGVEKGDAERVIIPIENTLGGSIHRNYDFLLRHSLWIMGEIKIRIIRNLIVNHGVQFTDIRRVYSHPQGLSQCHKYLTQYPQIEKVSIYESAASAKMVKEDKMLDAAAIASKQAAAYYDLEVLEEGIEDLESNYTRYLILSKSQEISSGANQTSIVFSAKNVPGMLFRSLGVFALRDINLGRLESRPVYGKPWEYFLYLDIEENVENERLTNAINELEGISTYVKILGCYERGQ